MEWEGAEEETASLTESWGQYVAEGKGNLTLLDKVAFLPPPLF